MKVHPSSSIFPLLEGHEFEALVEDVRKHGLHEKIVLHPDGSILDGRNRHRACQKAGVDPTFRTWSGRGSPVEFVVSMNIHRRHLTASQRAVLALEIEPRLAKEAKDRQLAAQNNNRGKAVREKIPEQLDAGRARDKAAAVVGVNPRYVSDAKTLRAKAPEKLEQVKAGKKTLQEAKQEFKQDQKQAVAERIRQEPKAPPEGPFRVIVIDPPWRYASRADDLTHRGRTQYPDMALSEIKALPVADNAHDDCILWLWTTNAFMREAFECLDAWGFENKTILTWVKNRMGLGDWLRGQTEHCLMAIRGKPVVMLTNHTTALLAPVREHSRKPDEFYRLVESLCPGNKLEMFARQERAGWQAWGAEIDAFVAT